MKKIISIALSLLFCLGLPLISFAEELTTCTVTADSIPAVPGEEITVSVRIAENPGFTNFAISLEYDSEKLELLGIHTAEGGNPYLCGPLVSVNTAGRTAEDVSCGFITAASPEVVKGDGILFTASFQANDGFFDTTRITPKVRYIRNNEAVFSVFEEITACVTAGTITAIVAGDVNGDGLVEYDDVMFVYKVFREKAILTEEQMGLADMNGDKVIDIADVEAIYRIYTGG